MSYADDSFSVAVLELPYIFGTQPGRRPVWMFLAEQIRGSKGATLYPEGGSTMVTVRQVGEALAGALEKTKGGKCWPIGWDNLTWNEMLTIAHKAMGCPDKRIRNIPRWMFNFGVKSQLRKQRKRGVDGGLYLPKLGDIQYGELFIDKSLGCESLGVQPDDIEAAITDSIRLCVSIMDGKVNAIGMKGE